MRFGIVESYLLENNQMKLAFGMIAFNSDYVLRQVLECVYPYASVIAIAQGPVGYWQDKGHKTSSDNTNNILYSFPDPTGKIKIVHGQWSEKDQQCNAYMKFVNEANADYLFQIDSDECYKSEDIENVIRFLEKEQPTSCGVKPYSFYGGFDRYVTGFEQATDNFLRAFRLTPDCFWKTHRPPTIQHKSPIQQKHISSDQMFNEIGLMMYHYSYCFPSQVKQKMEYYESKVAINKIIPDYFNRVYLPWISSETDEEREMTEHLYSGTHEFKPEYRGPAFTAKFEGTHPEPIQKTLPELLKRFEDEKNKV